MNNTEKYHIHHNQIIAWAEGAKVQILLRSENIWIDVLNPNWDTDRTYRVKPKLTEAEQRLIRLEECAVEVQARIEEVKEQIEEEKVLADTASEQLSKIEKNTLSGMVLTRSAGIYLNKSS